MTGKCHLITAASGTIITDTSFKLISDLLDKPNWFTTYRDYMTHNIINNTTATNVTIIIICVFSLFLGSLLPDIDTRRSILGRFIHIPIKHRTFTHCLLFVLPFIIGGIFLLPLLWLSYGIMCHLFFDSFSKSGICWFWPISQHIRYENGAFMKKRHLLKLYSVGEWSEYFWVIIVSIIALILAVKVY